MIEYLEQLLEDLEELRTDEEFRNYFINYTQKVFALETAIDIFKNYDKRRKEDD